VTVAELLDQLADLDPNAPVRLAQQPAWPFEWTLAGVVGVDDLAEDGQVVYLVEGDQLGYLPDAAAELLGWGR
jgi:hypothetical protein